MRSQGQIRPPTWGRLPARCAGTNMAAPCKSFCARSAVSRKRPWLISPGKSWPRFRTRVTWATRISPSRPLDEPAAVTRSGFGRVPVLGFLFHETHPIRRVLATFDLQAWQTVTHTQSSPGPAAHFPQFPNARECGLFGLVDVPAQLPNPVTLRLYAELADGSLHLCSVQRSRLFTTEDEKAPYPPQTSASFAAASAALQDALQERGTQVIFDAEMETELARISGDLDARAPSPSGLHAAVPLPRFLRPPRRRSASRWRRTTSTSRARPFSSSITPAISPRSARA